MSESVDNTWIPRQKHKQTAHVLNLAKKLNLPDYDALHAFSIQNPADYWNAVIEFLGISWSVEPAGYVDLDRGPEFPRWFPGGELNWVDTILAWGDGSEIAHSRAVIAEQEDGIVAEVTFHELASKIRNVATGLRRHGIQQGDRVGLMTENGVEATVSFLAIAYLGAIAVPLFSGFGVDAMVSRLSASGARALISTTGFHRRGKFVDVATPMLEALRSLPAIDLVFWKPHTGTHAPEGGMTWDALADRAWDGIPAARMSANDPFLVIFTSGTTGKPKGIVHTHGGFPLKIAHDSAVHLNVGRGDVFCWPSDMGWIAGALVLASALLRGATLVCYDGAPDFPDWSRMSRIVERHGVTHFGATPTLIRALASNVPQSLAGDRSTVELLITAGEVIAPEHFTWYRKNFGRGDTPVINTTGGTEASGSLLASVVVKPIAPGGFNTGSPGVEVAVVDPAGHSVVDAVGELAILKPYVGMTCSFWQDDERYLDTYWRTIPGLWVHGDLAMYDPGIGYVVLGRSDDTLKIAGKRLGPAEVEEILADLPGVHEVAAIGVDDPANGQKLVLFIVPTCDWSGEVDGFTAAIGNQIVTRLGKPFKPSLVHFVTQLPKTRSSKIMRRLVRNIYCGQPAGDLSSLANPEALKEIEAAIPA